MSGFLKAPYVLLWLENHNKNNNFEYKNSIDNYKLRKNINKFCKVSDPRRPSHTQKYTFAFTLRLN